LLMVNSTVGTTVEGNIDPITEIGEICAKYKIWHHVDAAYGGAFLMSEKLKKKIGSF
jgi:glutamate/tyrosine decarboxylase-like PLP-dependent enzyme